MVDTDKFDRHINAGKSIAIGEDTFHLKPLSYEHLSDIYRLAEVLGDIPTNVLKSLPKDIDGLDEITEEQKTVLFKLLKPEFMGNMAKVCVETMKVSYPDQPKEKMEQFARDNMMILFPVVMEINNSEK